MIYKLFEEKILAIFNEEKINLPKQFALAVSGGSDSLSLMILSKKFADKYNIKLLAITINYQIRPNSTNEAKLVAKIAKEHKINHKIITIDKKNLPNSNIEANLRAIRYQIFKDICQKKNINHLLTGHHCDDMAENFMIRLWRGSSIDGLSALAEYVTIDKINIIRPLLIFHKKELQNFLLSMNINWCEDESNYEEKFLRNKIRHFINSFNDSDIIKKRIIKTAKEIRKASIIIEESMINYAEKMLYYHQNGYFIIDQKRLIDADKDIAIKILSILISDINNSNYKPRFITIEKFYYHLITENFKPITINKAIAKLINPKFHNKNLENIHLKEHLKDIINKNNLCSQQFKAILLKRQNISLNDNKSPIIINLSKSLLKNNH
jgi:tRNA(Ile)-lysidine synthase